MEGAIYRTMKMAHRTCGSRGGHVAGVSQHGKRDRWMEVPGKGNQQVCHIV